MQTDLPTALAAAAEFERVREIYLPPVQLTPNHATFIAHARSTTLPAIVRDLVAEVERLRGEQ